MPKELLHWPSLASQVRLAERLYGDDGVRLVTRWLVVQVQRIGNPEFARLFSDHIDVPGTVSLDYAHRLVRSSRGSLIGGIRFFGQDVGRPFVEVFAHDFHDMTALADTVAEEWRVFSPSLLRLRVMPDERPDDGAHLDTSVYAARYRDMAPRNDRVRLTPFEDFDAAMALVNRRFDHMERADPALRRNVSPIEPGDLRDVWEAGRVHAIVVDDCNVVGLIATAPGRIDWIEGDEVMEEIVSVEYAGHGYAAAAQAALAALPSNDLDTLLVGTIDGLNKASRRTAERARRQRIMDYVFLSLA